MNYELVGIGNTVDRSETTKSRACAHGRMGDVCIRNYPAR